MQKSFLHNGLPLLSPAWPVCCWPWAWRALRRLRTAFRPIMAYRPATVLRPPGAFHPPTASHRPAATAFRRRWMAPWHRRAVAPPSPWGNGNSAVAGGLDAAQLRRAAELLARWAGVGAGDRPAAADHGPLRTCCPAALRDGPDARPGPQRRGVDGRRLCQLGRDVGAAEGQDPGRRAGQTACRGGPRADRRRPAAPRAPRRSPIPARTSIPPRRA